MPLEYATRADDGSLYVTVMCDETHDADSLQLDLENLPGVLSVYRKPPATLP
ncbi:MAG: hypothetical protein KDJ77_03215 [Rhodobiaceae bacterium]|nr:hypothetical protein [Rhodobiaceae bacterium]